MQTKSQPSPNQTRTGVRKVRIDAEQAGQRVDNFLRRELPGLPKGRLYRLLRRGEVRVNGGRVKADYKLAAGDELRIPPVTLESGPAAPSAATAASLLSRIVFEDRDLLVLDKPPGLAVHGGSGLSHGAIELLRAARPELRDLSLAHRIDRETSGCLVFAKRRSVLRQLHESFRRGEVAKNYLALVHGDWQFGERRIDRPLLVSHRKSGERHVVVSSGGKPAVTHVRLSRLYPGYSLLQCSPETGRTHQIRVHLADAGHAIAGDERYSAESDQILASSPRPPRLFLHAQSISFLDSRGNDRLFTAPIPEDLQRFLGRLERASKGDGQARRRGGR